VGKLREAVYSGGKLAMRIMINFDVIELVSRLIKIRIGLIDIG
jgi:hypothetical protein